jgi:hypothetical protein
MQVLDFPQPEIFTLLPEDEGDMATNKGQLQAIDVRLNAIEEVLKISPQPMDWWKSRYDWFINHKGTSLILAIILCLVGVFGGGYFKYSLDHKNDDWNRAVDDRIDKTLSTKGGIKETLASVQQTVASTDNTLKTLAPFIQDVIRHQFESVSSLPTASLKQRLPAVRHLVSVARDQAIQVSPASVNRLTENLLAIQPRPAEFWAVSADLLSYRSLNDETRQLLTMNLPDCADSSPTPNTVIEADPHKFTVKFGSYENCRFTLDSEQDDQRINAFLNNTTPHITFKHCLIVYRGGAINLIIGWNNRLTVITGTHGQQPLVVPISGTTFSFQDCLFTFSIPDIPPPNAQKITMTLLAQNGGLLTLPNP